MKWRAPIKIEVLIVRKRLPELLRNSLLQKRRPQYPPEAVLCWR